MKSPITKKRISTRTLLEMKAQKEKIAVLTAYDYTSAKILDQAGIDVLIVGDSAANVMAGHETTLPMTLDQMIYHAQSVSRACQNALVVMDLPFGTFQLNPAKALESAIRAMQETGIHGLKVEGGEEYAESIEIIIKAGIPVMGHLGLQPQSVHQYGGYGVQAADEAAQKKLIRDALLLEKLGCFAIVLEKIPADLTKKVSKKLKIPTIGIGAGNAADGQVLVTHDMLGLTTDFKPKFLRRYANLAETAGQAVKSYIKDVKSKDFPNKKEEY